MRHVQSVINSISNVEVWANGATGLLNANSLNSLKTAVSGLSKEQALLVLSTKNLTQAQKEQVLIEAGIIASNDKINASIVQRALAESTLTAEQQKDILTKLELINVETGEVITTNACTKASLEEALAKKGIVGADAEAIISSMGLTSANATQTISFDLLTASIWANIKALGKWLVTNPIGWAILGGTAIFGLVKAYDALTDSTEEVKERTDALLDSYNTAISEANSNAKTIESLASRYETLSKGVNNLGENVSLTADEYSEYNDIVNQIAEMFPTMITGYTDEGNAILSLKGNVEELRDAYKEAQKEAYNLLIVSGKDSDGNDIITNYKNQIHGNESFLSTTSSYIDGEAGAKDAIDVITKLTGALTPDEFRETYNQLYEEYKNIWNSDKIQDALKSSGFEELTHAPKWSELTVEDLANVKYSAQATIQTYQAEIDSQLQNVRTLANAYLMTNSDYEKLDEQSKTAVSLLVNSIDESIVDGFENKSDVGAYVAELISSISNNKDAKKALTELFTLDTTDMPVNDIQSNVDSYISTIATAIGEDPVELKIRLGFDYVNELEAQYQRAVDYAKDKFDNYDPTAFFKENSINTQEEIDKWLEIAQAANSAAEAEKKYVQRLPEETNLLDISSTIDNLNSQLKPAFDSLKSAYQNIFTDDGFTLDDIDILSVSDAIKSDLDDMSELGLNIDYSSYEDFVSVISNSEATEQEVEKAFNSLATSIANVGITGAEDFTILKSVLDNLGVENSEIIAFQSLVENTEALKETGLDLENATNDEIEAFANETVSAENVNQAILSLYLNKLALSDSPIDTTDEVEQLINVAETAGVAAETISMLRGMVEDFSSSSYTSLIDEYKAEKDLLNTVTETLRNEVILDWAEEGEEDAESYTSSFMSSFESEISKLQEKSFKIDGTVYLTMDTEDLLGTIESIKSLADDIGKEIDLSKVSNVEDLNKVLSDLEEQYIDTYVAELKLENTDLAEMLKKAISSCIKMKAHLDSVNNSLDTMQSNYSSLLDVMETYNENGFITIDQLQTLLEMDDKYVALLIDEGNQLSFNEDAYKAIFKAKLDEARATAIEEYNTALHRLELEAQQRTMNESSKQGGVISRYIEKLKEMGNSLIENSGFLSWMKNKILDVNNAIKATINNTEYTPPDYGAWDAQFDAEAKEVENALQIRLKNIDDIWSAAQNSGNWGTLFGRTDSSSSSDADDFSETFDWIEIVIQRIEESIERLSTTAGSAYKTFSARNKALKSEISSVNSEIELQQQAYNRYMQQANSVGLSSGWAKLVQSGSIDISTITDEDLADKISEYQEWYDKAIACKDAITNLNETLGDLYSTSFDNVVSQYDAIISVIEHKQNMIDAAISQTEEKGYLVSTQYYQALIKTEQENIVQMQQEKVALTNALNEAVASGAIIKASEEWYNMVSQIDDVTVAIEEANTAMIEYSNSIRDIEWGVFDLMQDRISKIADEADFLIDLMSNDKLYDDRGQLTNEGLSTMGLHGLDYNVYMAQADKYAQEMLNIDKELADDPYNQDLVDRREELLELQQEMILAAEDEKQAIVDMVEEGIELELDSLSELIEKYEDALSQQRDLYDYQQKIKDQTSELANLQKVYSSYLNDTSEETKAKVQQLKVSIDEAQQELEETQYDQFISDQKKLMDELYTEYETILNQRLDNVDALISDMITEINNGSTTISTTLSDKAESVGYTLSDNMSSIWDTSTGKITDVLTVYGTDINNGISSAATTVNNTLNTINGNIQSMVSQLNTIANTKTVSASTSSVATTPTTTTTSSTSTSNTSSNTTSTTKTTSETSNSTSSKWGSWFVKKVDTYPKDKLNVNTSIVDRLKWFNYDSSISARAKYYAAMGGSGVYTGSAQQNVWMLNEMKAHGFAKGGTIGNLINKTGEDGFVLARTGEEILSLEKIQALGDAFAQMNPVINSLNSLIPSLPNIPTSNSNTSNNIDNMNIEFVLPNVENYEDFMNKMKKDKQFEKLIQSVSIDRLAGKSALRKYNV